MLANSANNNIPFLLKLPWDSAFASCIIEGESLCIEKQEVKLQSTQGVRCRVCWANSSAFSACQVRWPGLFPCRCVMCCCPLGKVLHTLSPSCLLCPLYFVNSCLLLKSLGLSEVFIYLFIYLFLGGYIPTWGKAEGKGEVFIYKQMQKCLSTPYSLAA